MQVNLRCSDALEGMSLLSPNSIDLICTDLPYGITQNKWDSVIPLPELWNSFNTVLKTNGVVVLTASQPFTSMLVMSNLAKFKYDLVWNKTIASGQLNVAKQPLRTHESILVFYSGTPTYNEQKTEGDPYKIHRKAKYKEGNYGVQKESTKENEGFRHAKSVITVSNPRIKDGHPTQKPLELMKYLIKSYSNEEDMVLDCCMGSGTTGVACVEEKRNFTGIELNKKYCLKAADRINEANK